jgi:hypothetical protein
MGEEEKDRMVFFAFALKMPMLVLQELIAFSLTIVDREMHFNRQAIEHRRL